MKYKIEPIEEEDLYLFKLHFNGPKFFNILEEIYRILRSKVKHTNEIGSWEEAYKVISDALNESNIDLYDI